MEPIAYAIVTKNGGLQKIYYGLPTQGDLIRDAGWSQSGPHRIVPLFAGLPIEPRYFYSLGVFHVR